LTEAADGEFLLLTDADTIHGPQSISWAMTNMLDHRADFISGYTRQKIGSFGEALIVPAIYLVTAFFLPVWLIPRTRRPDLSFAIGQLVIARAEAFRKAGGYAAIRASVVDDLALARGMKAAGFKTLFLDAARHVDCRMYSGFRGAFGGLVKNIYAAIGKRLPVLLTLILLIVFAIELPLVNLAYRVFTGGDLLLLSALPVVVFFAMWLLTLVDRKLSPLLALLYPVLFLNLIAIASVSTVKTGYGQGALWKNRRVK
jgi:chlorobactene glucosyltransferase